MLKKVIILLSLFFAASIFAHDDMPGEKINNLIVFNESDNVLETIIYVSDWKFSENIIKLDTEKNNRLIFIIESGHHGIAIPDLELSSGNITKDQKVIWDFKSMEITPGEYDFFCNVQCGKGHKEMVGKLIFEGNN